MAWIKRFFADLIGAHVDGVRAVAGMKLLFALLIGWEFAQHVMEVRIGFFDSREAARAVQNDPSRMVLGWVKMLSVYLGGFLVIRFLVARAGEARVDPVGVALRRYLPYLAYALAMFAIVFYAPSFAGEWGREVLRPAVGLLQVAIEPLLMAWVVAAATDGSVRGPIASARRTGWLYLYALPLFFVGRLPVNTAHYLLNRLALGQPPALLWPMLIVDAVVVGLIIAVIPAISVRVARLVLERREAAPAPSPHETAQPA